MSSQEISQFAKDGVFETLAFYAHIKGEKTSLEELTAGLSKNPSPKIVDFGWGQYKNRDFLMGDGEENYSKVEYILRDE